MDYKSVKDWDEGYLEHVLDDVQRKERNHIEFKSSYRLQLNDREEREPEDKKKVAQKKEAEFRELLAQALSAFGNRPEGGYFLVGVDNHGKIDGGLSLSYKNDAKEWFERIIPVLTDKESMDCEVSPVKRRENDESQFREGRAVFVIWIPPHPEMPIRSMEGTHDYYYRTNSQSVPLAHQQVLDIIHRRTTPTLGLKELSANVRGALPEDPSKVCFELQFHVTNSSSKMAVHVGAELLLPPWLATNPRASSCAWGGIVRQYDLHSVCFTRLDDGIFPHQSAFFPWVNLVMDLRQVIPELLGHQAFMGSFAACPEIAVILYADDAPPSWWPLSFEEPPLGAQVTGKVLDQNESSIVKIRHYREYILKNRRVDIEPVVQQHLGIPVEARTLQDP